MAIGAIELEVHPDLSKFRGELSRETSGAGDEAGSHAGSNFLSGFGKVAIAGAAVAGAGIVAALGVGAKIAGDLEQSQIAFETLFGNAETATKFLGDLKTFAAATPFDLPGLTSASQKLAAAGISAENILPIMSTLGDSIAAMGGGSEQIDRATLALQQMALKGKVSGEEMLQLAEAGVPAWDALASKMGVTVAEAQKKVSDGLVDYTTLYDALGEKSGAALQRSAGAMEKQAQSFQGLLSTMKDTLQIGLAEAVGPALLALKPLFEAGGPLMGLLANVGQIIAPIATALVTAFQAALPGISALSDGLVALVGAVGPAFGQLMTALAPVFSALGGALGGLLATLGPIFAQLLSTVQPLIVAIGSGLVQVLVTLAPTFLNIINAALPLIDAIIKPLVALIPVVTPIISLLGAQLGSALTSLAPAIQAVVEFLAKLLTAIAPLIAQLGSKLGDILVKLAPIFVKLVEAALPLLSAILDPLINVLLPAILPVLGSLIDALLPVIDAFVTIAAQIGPIVAPLFAQIAQVLAELLMNLTPLLPPLSQLLLAIVPLVPPLLQLTIGILPLLVQLLGLVLQAVPPLVGVLNILIGVITGVVNVVVSIVTWIANLEQVIMQKLPGAINWLIDAGGNIISGLLTGIVNGAQAVWNWFAALPRTIAGYFAGAWNWLVGVGGDIIGGLASGISSGAQSVWNFFINLPSTLRGYLWGATTWLYGVGADIVRGLWNGISGMGDWLRGKLSSFASSIIPGPIKSVLGIGSPSRVMARDVGVPLAQGIAVGFGEGIPAAARAMAADAGRLVNSVSPLASSLGSQYGTGSGGPQIQVFIGETELTEIVRTQVRRSDSALATTLAGRLH